MASLQEALEKALDERDLMGEVKGRIDKEVLDYAEHTGTFEPEMLAVPDSAWEYVDGSAPTIYDDDAYEVCKSDPALADEVAVVAYEAQGWHDVPLNKLPGVAALVLERRLCQRVMRHRDELEDACAMESFLAGARRDEWGLGGIEADEDEAREAVAGVLDAAAAGDMGAAEDLLEEMARSTGPDGRFDYGAYKAAV